MEKKLFCDTNDKMLGGVSSGLACYFNLEANLIRILWVLLTLFTGPWTVIAYCIMWIILPKEDGSIYNVDPNAEFKPETKSKSRGCFSRCLVLLFSLCVAFIALIALVVLFGILLGGFAIVVGVLTGEIALQEAVQAIVQ